MNYNDCQKIVNSTKHIFTGTNYGIDYYLDGEPYFTKDGEIIEDNELPEDLKEQVYFICESLGIDN